MNDCQRHLSATISTAHASPGSDVQVGVSSLEQLPRDLGKLGEEVLTVNPRLELVGTALLGGDEKRDTGLFKRLHNKAF